MNISALFIQRPVATSLLAVGIVLAGVMSFFLLPVSSLPQIEFPTILVQASLPGSSPKDMASSVAIPLESSLSRIAGITDMTSSSTMGSTKIILQFDLNRNIDGAARDVQAALNSAMPNLPSNMPTNPIYFKVNPADSPIMVLAISSDNYKVEDMYNVASTVLQQKLLQISGVGQITVAGSSLPAVRVEIDPKKLNQYGVSLTQVAQMIGASNINPAKGAVIEGKHIYNIITNDELFKADEYKNLIISSNNGNILRLKDVAEVKNSVQDRRNLGLLNDKQAVLLIVYKSPGANVIATSARIKSALNGMKAYIPADMKIHLVLDRTSTIKASLKDVEITLFISMLCVIAVVYLFLGNISATLIPGIAMILSLLGTLGVMWTLGFSLNILSLMALTISTGFVVDDAIVVLENVYKHLEAGLKPKEAALQGAAEIGFTVLSISISLVAVFIPLLCMGGIVGRLFSEFAVTLAFAVLISMVISLTITPTMCAYMLKNDFSKQKKENVFTRLKSYYKNGIAWSLSHSRIMLYLLFLIIALNITLFIFSPKGFFPQQDTGIITGSIVADQDSSFQSLTNKFHHYMKIIKEETAVESVLGFIGNGNSNSGRLYIMLKPLAERKENSDLIIGKLRKKLNHISGATVYMQTAQDLVIGGRQGNSQFQYTISGNSVDEVNHYAPIIMKHMASIPGITDINSDQGNHSLQVYVKVDYDKAASYGINAVAVDKILYSAFGQSSVSTMYTSNNQYYVVMEIAPEHTQDPQSLQNIYIPANNGKLVPLSSFATFTRSASLLSVNHQGLAPSATISFNLLPGSHLGDAVNMVKSVLNKMILPKSIFGEFRGTAAAFQDSLANEGWLILAALIVVYLVLGILYEDLLHPITILSTLPSAGVGALLALLITGTDLTVIALIGIILLIGIVKKNAIMMIDFVLTIKKQVNISTEAAISEAAISRFRPIMMTTMSAIFGAIPMVLNNGMGSEFQRPLGIAIIGGLLFSQMLTLFSTPVICLYIDKLKYKK